MSRELGRASFEYIAAALGRGKGTWVLERAPAMAGAHNVAVLVAGAPQGLRFKGGVVITLGLTRESLQSLRDLADELLKQGGPS
jgi:hypothetical protein